MRSYTSEKKVSAFQIAKSTSKMPSIILVNPFLDANVGAVSRAMLNFGFHDLRIVNPECNILSENARTLAVGSVELLENAKVYDTLIECIADLDTIFATTARSRSIKQEVITPDMAAALYFDDSKQNVPTTTTIQKFKTVGIMFGRERNGLSNEEISMADKRIYIPTFEEYDVLNLSQAVNIICYEFWKKNSQVNESDKDDKTSNECLQNVENVKNFSLKVTDELATRIEVEHLLKKITRGLHIPMQKIFDDNNANDIDLNVLELNKDSKSANVIEYNKNNIILLRTIIQKVCMYLLYCFVLFFFNFLFLFSTSKFSQKNNYYYYYYYCTR
jgi:tRNA/rRNA methyltransferase